MIVIRYEDLMKRKSRGQKIVERHDKRLKRRFDELDRTKNKRK